MCVVGPEPIVRAHAQLALRLRPPRALCHLSLSCISSEAREVRNSVGYYDRYRALVVKYVDLGTVQEIKFEYKVDPRAKININGKHS